METELVKAINFYNKFVKGKNFSDEKLQNILADCLFRYIHLWEVINNKGKTEVIDAIKGFHKSLGCKNRYEEVFELLVLLKINETNRLLLIKSVFLEEEYEIKNVSCTQQD